jgi:hypothetical protein
MSRILAIDPGNTESAYVVVDQITCRPIEFGKVPNDELLGELEGLTTYGHPTSCDVVAIEMIASYGMAVGAEVFETCVWIGRYQQQIHARGSYGVPVDLVKRHPVKVHHCHSAAAKDSNISQALVDRFAPGRPNRGKGTKADPGWFYGFAADVWQAYALAVYIADTTSRTGERP